MKILILSEWYSEKMGYAENYLPEAFGRLGHEVHLITTDLQVYATFPHYESVYLNHLGPKQVEQGVFKKKYFTLHRNPHSVENGLEIIGLEQKINEIRPDIVYCFEFFVRDTIKAIELKDNYGYRLFCESRMHQSIYHVPKTKDQKDEQKKIFDRGRLLSGKIDRFYPIAPDVLHIITRYLGVPKKKCKIISLAVDTDLFHPALDNEEVKNFRRGFGFKDDEIVCIYTGRFTEAKGPLVLAKAIDHLQGKGMREFKGFFIGQGDEEYTASILAFKGCSIHPFVDAKLLSKFYQSLDIGVWPFQESTSQLDAAACGMPIIINEKVKDDFRIQGNGLRYKDNDHEDLALKILKLKSPVIRREMGLSGSEKIAKYYSWDKAAEERICDIERNMRRKMHIEKHYILKKILPPFTIDIYRKLRGNKKEIVSVPDKYGWFGEYRDWETAKKECTGYDTDLILEKVTSAILKVRDKKAAYERDAVVYYAEEYNYTILSTLFMIAAGNNGILNVLDFGGSLGSTYYQNRKFLDEVKVHWNIVEQEKFVKRGKELFETEFLRFYYTIDECMAAQKVNSVLISSTLQYIEKPYDFIRELVQRKIPYIILDRTAIIKRDNDLLTVQKVSPELFYEASYPSWFFNKEKLLNAFSEHYEMITEFDSLDRYNIPDAYVRGFFFKLR